MDKDERVASPLNSEQIITSLRGRMKRVGKQHLALEHTLPMIVEHLSQVIVDGVDPQGRKKVWLDLENSTLEDIVTEYDVLKDIILDELSPLSGEEKNKVIETILYYMGLSAWEYSKQTNVHHEAVEKELYEKIRIEVRDKNWFENVLDSLPVGILIVERTTGNLLFVNKTAKALAGGFYPMDILPDDQSEYYATDVDGKRISRNDLPRFRVARGERLCGYELTAHFPDGQITIVIHSDIIPASEGHPERIVLAFQEIQERKKWEADKLAVVNDLKEERELRESFVSSLTHDLRTPLSVARMHAEMISRKVSDDQLLKCRKVIKHIDEVDRMIQDLLDANKLKAGETIPIHPCEICLNDVVQEAVTDFVDLHGDRFIVSAPDRICGIWCGKAMRRILDNLLGNAVKYGDSGPIDIQLEQDEKCTRIKVHNSGAAIPFWEQARLFEPYKRARKADKKMTGWGIGLSLVKGLVEAHDGKASVDSHDETGTTFKLEFPNRVPSSLH
ncbi:MAG: ATP-binding protein [Bdellovibrionota bacterium]